MERASEAKLWNEIFTWTEAKLGLQQGVIKASVLIENILACFEAEDILYEMREHSYGLNCGIWDYAASIIAKFGKQGEENCLAFCSCNLLFTVHTNQCIQVTELTLSFPKGANMSAWKNTL